MSLPRVGYTKTGVSIWGALTPSLFVLGPLLWGKPYEKAHMTRSCSSCQQPRDTLEVDPPALRMVTALADHLNATS